MMNSEAGLGELDPDELSRDAMVSMTDAQEIGSHDGYCWSEASDEIIPSVEDRALEHRRSMASVDVGVD
jgi:hypothetical protein